MKHISRRDMLKIGAAGFAAGLLRVNQRAFAQSASGGHIEEWKAKYDQGAWIGRVISPTYFSDIAYPVRSRPNPDAPQVGSKKADDIVVILREIVGLGVAYVHHNHRWYETPEGYLYAPNVYPMSFQTGKPLETIDGDRAWVEVTVPWVEGRSQPSEDAPILALPGDRPTLLYYASNYPATKVARDGAGRSWYLLEENAAPMYARAEGFRVISKEEVTPIHPDAEEKSIVVNLNRQSLSAFEGKNEVYYAPITSGPFLSTTSEWVTPPGEYRVYWKRIGVRMEAGTSSYGYSDPGVGWATYFISSLGIAIHSTYWHNSFGEPGSNGCINMRPKDAQWIFRWTTPQVEYTALEKWNQDLSGTLIRVTE